MTTAKKQVIPQGAFIQFREYLMECGIVYWYIFITGLFRRDMGFLFGIRGIFRSRLIRRGFGRKERLYWRARNKRNCRNPFARVVHLANTLFVFGLDTR
jgi:hypothetical protein